MSKTIVLNSEPASGVVCANAVTGGAYTTDNSGACCANTTPTRIAKCLKFEFRDIVQNVTGTAEWFSVGSLDQDFYSDPPGDFFILPLNLCSFSTFFIDPDIASYDDCYTQTRFLYGLSMGGQNIAAQFSNDGSGTYQLWVRWNGEPGGIFNGLATSASPIDFSSPITLSNLNVTPTCDIVPGNVVATGGTVTITQVECPCKCECVPLGAFNFTLGIGDFGSVDVLITLTTCGGIGGAEAVNATYRLFITATVRMILVAGVCKYDLWFRIVTRTVAGNNPYSVCFYRYQSLMSDDPTDVASWSSISADGGDCFSVSLDGITPGVGCDFDASTCPEFFRGLARLTNGSTDVQKFCLKRKFSTGGGGAGSGTAVWEDFGVDYYATLTCLVIDDLPVWALDIQRADGKSARFTQPLSGCPANSWTFSSDGSSGYTGGEIITFEETDGCAPGTCADCSVYFVNLANSDDGFYDGVYGGDGMGFVGPPPYICYWDGESINFGPAADEIVRTEAWRDDDDPSICYLKLTITSSSDATRIGHYYLLANLDSGNCLPLFGWVLIENTIDTSTTISVFLSL